MKKQVSNIILFLIASYGIFLYGGFSHMENTSFPGNYYTILAYLVFVYFYIDTLIILILTYRFIRNCNLYKIVNIKYIIAITLFLISTFLSIKRIQFNVQNTIFYDSKENISITKSTINFIFSCINKLIIDIKYIDFFSFEENEVKPIINFIIIILLLIIIIIYAIFTKIKFPNTKIKFI